MIIDAAINLELNATDRYDAYRSGKELDVYMKVHGFLLKPQRYLSDTAAMSQNPDGSEYIGQVWPGATSFPDW